MSSSNNNNNTGNDTNNANTKKDVKCETCNSTFVDEHAANQHMDDLGHWEYYCHQCARKFLNDANLRLHLHSATHEGKTVECPSCNRVFTTMSSISGHLERGACSETKGPIHEAIQKILAENQQDLDIHCATEHAWNGTHYQCYLCNRGFDTLMALNQHIPDSHHEKAYQCPNKDCKRQCLSLNGLFRHLESEACGHVRFGQIKQNAQKVHEMQPVAMAH